MKRWHAWLELARISNLPTVWTNVLAGWLLAGGAWHFPRSGWKALGGLLTGTPILWLLLGASLIYTAGMILNDAFDAGYDREHRKERPIPSGRVSLRSAWVTGLGMLAIGAVLCWLGAGACGWLVIALVAAILVYDAYHKPWPGSVFIMGACRTLLYLVAGSAVARGLEVHEDFLLIVKAIALGGYVVGLSLVARSEGGGKETVKANRWVGWVGLILPVLAGVGVWMITLAARKLQGPRSSSISMSIGEFILGDPYNFHAPWLQVALLMFLSVLLAHAVTRMRTPPPSNIGRAVGLLLAGIVVVDGLAISFFHPVTSVVFAASMPLLLLWQRKIAAT